MRPISSTLNGHSLQPTSLVRLTICVVLVACGAVPEADEIPDSSSAADVPEGVPLPKPLEGEEDHGWLFEPGAESLRKAIVHRDQMPDATRLGGPPLPPDLLEGPPASSARWQYFGPNSYPYGGRVSGLAYAPSNSAVRYLATAGGGVWRSRDSGATWTATTDSLPQLETSSIAVDPTNPDIVYVGTGNFDDKLVRYSLGILKTTNGGSTWTRLLPEAGDTAVSAIVIDPANPRIITATAGWGVAKIGYIWRSTDAGTTWTRAADGLSDNWSDIEIGAKSSNGVRYYYAVGGTSWLRSADRGANWEWMSMGTGRTSC